MDMTPQEYQEYVKRLAPKSPIFKDTAFAFFIGGAICALGQLIQNGFLSLGLAKADARHGDLDLPHLPLRTFNRLKPLQFHRALCRGRHARADHGLCQLRCLPRHRL